MIVGNSLFYWRQDICSRQGEAYAEASGRAPHMNESADYVMYWWDHAA